MLYKTQFQQDYLMLVMDSAKDYRRALQGFTVTVDGRTVKYRRLLGTTGSIKKSTIIFVNEEIHDTQSILYGTNPKLPLEPVVENEQTTEYADQDFYDAVDSGAFIVTENQTITINSNGNIIPPHEVAHTQAVHTGGIKSEEILENNSDLRITSPTKTSDTSAINKGKSTATIDVTISIE